MIAEAQKYSDTVECEDFVEKLDRRAIKLRYNTYCNDAKKYRDNFDAEVDLCRQSIAYNKSLKYKPVEGYYDGEYKQGELLDLSVFPDEVRNAVDDNWGESIPMEHVFSVEEILDMPTEGEVQNEPTMENIICVTGKDSDLIDKRNCIDNIIIYTISFTKVLCSFIVRNVLIGLC